MRSKVSSALLALVLAATSVGLAQPGAALTKPAQPASQTIKVCFASGKSSLSAVARQQLATQLEMLQKAAKVAVIGYARVGKTTAASKTLSSKRAKAVANYLSASGLVARLVVTGAGAPKTGAASSTADRVELKFVPTGGLLWSQDFNGPAGAALTNRYFTELTGDGTADLGLTQFGTGEIEQNTPDAVTLDGSGNMRISTSLTGGIWHSGRVWTAQKVAYRYGSIEIRTKLPSGDFNWPALWFLGDNYRPPNGTFGTKGWPEAGELDFVESLSGNTQVRSTLHGLDPKTGSAWLGGAGVSALAPLPLVDSGFHVWRMDWKPDSIAFYLDGIWYATFTFNGSNVVLRQSSGEEQNFMSSGSWPFNQPIFLIINNAVPKRSFAPEGSSSQLLIDYIHYSAFEGFGEVAVRG